MHTCPLRGLRICSYEGLLSSMNAGSIDVGHASGAGASQRQRNPVQQSKPLPQVFEWHVWPYAMHARPSQARDEDARLVGTQERQKHGMRLRVKAAVEHVDMRGIGHEREMIFDSPMHELHTVQSIVQGRWVIEAAICSTETAARYTARSS